MYKVYILYSEVVRKYYVGSTANIEDRMKRHNEGRSSYTKKGIPWKVVVSFESDSRSEAITLENKIKKRGVKRYLEDNLILNNNRGVAQSG